jgi:tetratricopeptide (TPR) repeat protein
MENTPRGKGRSTGRVPLASVGRNAVPPQPAGGSGGAPPQREDPRRGGISRGLLFAIIAVVALIAVGGTILGVTLLRGGPSSPPLAENLKRAAYYADKGEYEEALKILNTLNIDDPRVRAALDDVLAKKKAAAEAARQADLAAQQAQQDQLKASLAKLGDSLKNQQQKIVVQQPVTPPQENASQKEKELQKKVQELMQKGAAAFNAGRYTEARKAFDQAVALAPDNSDALAYDGLSYLRENPSDAASVQKAVDLSNRAIAKNPDNWLPHRTLGEIFDSRKLSDDAMREYKIAVRLNPGDADSLYALGKLQYRAKLFADAQKSFEGCVTLRPDFTSAHFNRAMSLVQLGEKARAIDAFKAAVATKKDFADAHYMIGSLLRDKGDAAGALDSFKLASTYAPDNAGYTRELASAYIARGDFASAETVLTRALAQDPENPAAVYNMASVKIKLGKAREALPFAQKAVEKESNAASNYIMGLANEKLGNAEDAVRYYGTAVQKDPQYAPALINLGGILDSRGMPEKALPLLLTAQDILPGSYEVQNNLGNVYLHQQQYQDSITHLSKALSIRPDSMVTAYNLGLAYAEVGQTAEAKSAFLEVAAKDSSNLDVYLKLARILIKEGNNKDAKDLLTKLVAKNPKGGVKEEAQKLLDQLK